MITKRGRTAYTKKRTYRSGSRWALWRWTEVDSEYIVRLHLIKTPWFAVCLHWFKKPDPEPHLHDHPVSFLSLVIRGSYRERRRLPGDDGWRFRTRRWFNLIRAHPDDRHRIVDVLPGTLTLALMGPKTREWGFHTPDGWVHWKDYYAAQRSAAATTRNPCAVLGPRSGGLGSGGEGYSPDAGVRI